MTKNAATAAPNNRTLFLDIEDKAQYGPLLRVETLERPVGFANLLDTIYCGDCVSGMRLLPDGSVDLIVADPPYNLGKDFGNSSDRRSPGEFLQWTSSWIKESSRILKATGSIYVCCDWRYSGAIQEILEDHFIIKNRITWRREKGRGSQRNWKNNMEDIWFAVASERYIFNADDVKIKKGIIAPYRVNGAPKDWIEANGERFRMTYPANIWTDTVVPFWSMPENTPHPAQKPELIVERILKASSTVGSLVLDPFMGSGTTAAVAKRLGRHYIGFELNEEYVYLALKRLDTRVKPPQLELQGLE